MAFDPDAYLAQQPTASSGFDPDAYLAQSAPDTAWQAEQEAAPPAGSDPVTASAFVAGAQEQPRKPQLPERREHPAIRYIRDVARAGLQGATLGFAEEVGAAVAAPVYKAGEAVGLLPKTGESVSDLYTGMRDTTRAEQKQFATDNPKTAIAAEIAGGVLPALASGGQTIAATGLKEVAKQGAKQGAAYGAAYGLGAGEGSALDQAKSTVGGGLLGGLTGGIITPALVGTAKTVNTVGQNIATRFASPEKQAEWYIGEVAKRSGLTPDDVFTELKRLGPNATLADVDENLLSAAKTAVDRVGSTKRTARAMVDARQLEQQKETLGILSKQLGGASPDDAAIALAKNAEEMTAKAAPLYEQALKANVQQTESLKKLQALPAFQKAYKQAGKYAANDLTRVAKEADPNMLGAGYKAGQLTEAEKLHYAKIAMYDMESAQSRAGNKNAAAQLADARRALTAELDGLPGYAEARQIWSGGKVTEEAADIGKNFFKMSPSEFKAAVSELNPYDKEVVKMGLMQAATEKVGGRSDRFSTAGLLTDNENSRQKLLALIGKEELDALTENASKWGKFTRTKNVVAGGSRTAENIAVADDLGVIEAMSSPQGFVKNALLNVISPVKLTGETAEKTGAMLTQQGIDPEMVRNMLIASQREGRNAVSKRAGQGLLATEGAGINAMMRE